MPGANLLGLLLGSLLQLDVGYATATSLRESNDDGKLRMPAETRQPDETFGQRIQRLRRERSLTQRQVAAELGIDFTYLSKLENDRGEPPGEDTVRKLAAVLQTDEELLLALAGKVPPELRERAQRDVEFARFLRRLPSITDEELRRLSKNLKIPPADQ
jgi:HTH-type transcriptional regulator, competence development regulator